jgi:hypothetical protein
MQLHPKEEWRQENSAVSVILIGKMQLMKWCLGVAVFAFLALRLSGQTYYVSATGDDSNPGTMGNPFKTIGKAVGVANPGTTIYVRGGTYAVTATISISQSGKKDSLCSLLAYSGERVVIDGSAMPFGSRGVKLNGSYWYIKGLDITHAGDNGLIINGSNNVIEFCSFSENYDSGLQLAGGASNNRIINCDSYNNADPTQGNADGFAPKLDVGTGNYFYGCRSWQNSDDGFDGYLRPSNNITTTLENCWSFQNGFLSDGTMSNGNGNGFKIGGSDAQNLEHNMILKKCLTFDNKAKGFDQNHNKGSMTLFNCTGYNNGGNNYSINESLDSGKTLTLTNCIEFGNKRSIGAFAVQTANSWMSPFTTPTAGDFVSVDTAGVRGPRKPDGSLPDVSFMHLATGSQFVDAGTDVGLPFNGSAPDLGCFESSGVTSVASVSAALHTFELGQNYPNPFNPSTDITFSVDKTGKAMLEVFDLLGQKMLTLFDDVAESGTLYKVKLHAGNLSSGVYFYRLESGTRSELKKLVVLK